MNINTLPKTLTEHGGIVKKSDLNRAFINAGYVIQSNRYKEEKIVLEKNEKKAKYQINCIEPARKIKDVIYLNVVFPHSAGYLKGENNIGHEIIDIFGGDDNEFHYYLNPWGIVGETQHPKYILSICQASTGLFKILNKAIIRSPEEHAVQKNNEKITNDERFKCQRNKFKYNSKFLETYYELNSGDNTLLSSFNCELIVEPAKPIYFAFDCFKRKGPNIYRLVSTDTGRTPKFINFNQSDQELLEKIVNDETLWKKTPIKSFKEYVKDYSNINDFNFFKELGIIDQELQYSNALRFFLKNFDMAKAFLKDIGCVFEKNDKIFVERERYNIDLFFSNFNTNKKPADVRNEKIVIIENKIKANVTPSDNDKSLIQQVVKIYKFVHSKDANYILKDDDEKEIHRICAFLNISENSDEEFSTSQLSKYYIYSVTLAFSRGWNESEIESNIKCFFLCPEYAKLHYDVNKKGYLENNSFEGEDKVLFLQEKYKLITYVKILKTFEKFAKKIPEGKYKQFYLDFIESIKVQANDRDDSLEQSMIEMFYRRSL